ALYRPGPMDWIPDYIRGKKDPSTVKFPHKLLEEVCRETYGVMVYQEQVMESAKVIAGYTLGGADMLRRAMGKKDADAMAKERTKFVEGAKRVNNIDAKTADSIFDILNKFAGYGFNKSHSAAYAVLSYQTGYLKANYPVQFMAAMLSSELGNSEKVSHFVAECESMGLTVLGPDVNESREMFTPVGEKIRFGLAGIKGVGEQAAQKILAEREANGPYRDFADFMLRADSRAINKRVLENLIATGAFDFSGAGREELFAQIDDVLAVLAELQRKYPGLRKDTGVVKVEEPAESMLFDLGATAGGAPVPDRAVLAAEFTELQRHTRRAPVVIAPTITAAASNGQDAHGMFDLGQAKTTNGNGNGKAKPAGAPERKLTAANRLQFEKELLGFYISGHPMNAYLGLADALTTHTEEQILAEGDRIEFRMCGVASGITKKLSRKDNRPWAFFNLATKRATVSVNMYSEAFESNGKNLAENQPVVILGNVMRGDDGARLNVKECYVLDGYLPGNIREITWLLQPEHPQLSDFLRKLRQTLNGAGGDTRIRLGFVFEGRAAPVAEVASSLNWRVDGAAFQALRQHPAVVGTQVEARRFEIKETRRWAKRS
ncbi:MAG: DNA polymerase III subunit alpha, partial [Lacunisphaera sp.]